MNSVRQAGRVNGQAVVDERRGHPPDRRCAHATEQYTGADYRLDHMATPLRIIQTTASVRTCDNLLHCL